MKKLHYGALPGVHKSPNIQSDPDLYEIENIALDPQGLIEAAMQQIAPWKDQVVLDLGAGTGFHVPRFHALAQHVFAVEPHGPSRVRIFERAARLRLERVSILSGSAEAIPLRGGSVDIVHARFAYFFAPHCEPGLRELQRVIRPGGTAFIIDNDYRSGTFARWLYQTELFRDLDMNEVDAFWERHGFAVTRIQSAYRFTKRADMENFVRLEFGETLAQKLLKSHDGLEVDIHLCLYHRRYG